MFKVSMMLHNAVKMYLIHVKFEKLNYINNIAVFKCSSLTLKCMSNTHWVFVDISVGLWSVGEDLSDVPR